MGGGGTSNNAHSLAEWYEPAGAWKGCKNGDADDLLRFRFAEPIKASQKSKGKGQKAKVRRAASLSSSTFLHQA